MRLRLALCLGLLVLTLFVYAAVGGNGFVNYDDDGYVTGNVHVARGLSWANLVWSLTAFENGNWHPLTLLSHMLDVSLFGMEPAWHHRVSLALHALNVLLLFALLAWTTSWPWRSALVAALFAIHPLNVESVAWIAERKTLLCTAFWLLALLAHARYRKRGGMAAYALVVLLAALSLAAKPMAVTLPLTLVLFDFWPLDARPAGRGSLFVRYARELALPLALSLLCAGLTLEAQHAARALQGASSYPLGVRFANSAIGYVWYLRKLLWPGQLAVFYPHPVTTVSYLAATLAALAMASLTFAALWVGGRSRHVALGWCWYLGTLLPVSGIVQVGSQAYADRYAYVPLIGLFVLIGWTLARAARKRPAWRIVLVSAAVLWVALLSVRAHAQVRVWHDSITLFRHALEVVPDSALAHNNLGMALVGEDRMQEALLHFEASVALAPWDSDARSNLGNALRALHRPAEAQEQYLKALRERPEDPSIHYNLATVLWDLGKREEADAELEEALRIDPGYLEARSLLGMALYRDGKLTEALAHFRELVRLDPNDTASRAWALKIENELRKR